MFKICKASVLAAAIVSSGLAAAETFDFTSMNPGGVTACGFNSGSDRCGTSLTFAQGSITATATATYASPNGAVGVKVVQDYNGENPTWVGLGVYHTNNTSDDNVTSKELLILTFNQVVTLTGLNLRAEGHGEIFGSQKTFLLNGNSNALAGSIGGLSLTGTTFTFGYGGGYGTGAGKYTPDQYYLSGMTVTAVPEPESLAMMLAGLGLMGGIARRRLRNRVA